MPVKVRSFRVLSGLALLGMAFAYGFLSSQFELFPHSLIRGTVVRLSQVLQKNGDSPAGFWVSVDDAMSSGDLLSEEQLERLRGLGYLSGYKEAGGGTGLLAHDKTRSYQGYNFYSSGHAPEAILMDMDGAVIHTWQYEPWDAWHDDGGALVGNAHDYWRRAYLLPNGDILAIYEGLSLVKLDKDSNLIWEYSGSPHHDLQVMEDGSIYVLTRQLGRRIEGVAEGEPIVEDFVTILDASGKEKRRISLLDAVANSEYSSLLDTNEVDFDPQGDSFDIFHTNTLEVLDGRLAPSNPAFAEGNLLISLRNVSAAAVVDIEQETVVWALRGMWKLPHQPTILPNGNLLVFDNLGDRGQSRVVELSPFTQAIEWEYKGDETQPFRSPILGSNQRLPNGNTLISDSVGGRAFEVTAENEIVWEFLNPQRAGSNRELIAVIPELIRLPPDFPLDWTQ